MNWIRCPTCRTANADPNLPCLGCGGSLAGGRAFAPGAESNPQGQVARDRKKVNSILVVLGVFGAVGLVRVLTAALATPYRLAAMAALVGSAIVGTTLVLKKDDSRFSLAGTIVLRTFAVFGILFLIGIALVIGLLILLFVVCAAGNFRIGG